MTVSGTRQNVSISQIIAIEGSRPSGFSGVNPTTVWHQAFVLLIGAGTTPPRPTWPRSKQFAPPGSRPFSNAVGGRGSISTTLGGETCDPAQLGTNQLVGCVYDNTAHRGRPADHGAGGADAD